MATILAFCWLVQVRFCHHRSGELSFASVCIMTNVLVFKAFWISESQIRNCRPVVAIVRVIVVVVITVTMVVVVAKIDGENKEIKTCVHIVRCIRKISWLYIYCSWWLVQDILELVAEGLCLHGSQWQKQADVIIQLW